MVVVTGSEILVGGRKVVASVADVLRVEAT